MMKDRQVTDEAFKTEEMKKSHFFTSPSSTNQKKKQSAAEKVLRLKLEHQVPQLPLRALFSAMSINFLSAKRIMRASHRHKENMFFAYNV